MILYTTDQGNYTNYNPSNVLKSQINQNVYVNLTNKCSCNCTFCLRSTKEMAESNTLWLKQEPTVQEIVSELGKCDFSKIKEVVFCGFGEPTMRLDDLIIIAKYLKAINSSIMIRLNTNGLSDLVYKKSTAPLLSGLIDTVSISLNASNAGEYLRLTRNPFGLNSYQAMLCFAQDCKSYIPNVVLSVVDCIGQEEIDASQAVCDKIGVKLRVRPFE